jgi:hypothetical protein
LREGVVGLVERGFIEPMDMNLEAFDAQLRRTLDDPTGWAGIEFVRIALSPIRLARFPRGLPSRSGRPAVHGRVAQGRSSIPCGRSAATTRAPVAAARN